ncbi:hypothetical protein FNF28_00057 [Cafeteria roenbergensis]|uniref:Uncharacterized protein n=1 Tax=Cafeteria roenbergensis TaxID=33653 RepID=A0A5A8E5Q1_CAFRO|nr:hypothetical protein FNF28_00057 [Cafeteria roenbergensis]
MPSWLAASQDPEGAPAAREWQTSTMAQLGEASRPSHRGDRVREAKPALGRWSTVTSTSFARDDYPVGHRGPPPPAPMPRPVSVRVASLSLGPTGRSDPDARRAPLDVGDFVCGPVPVFTDPGASAASRVRKLRYVDPPAAAPGPGEAAAPEGHAPFPAGRPIDERGPWADLGAGAVAHQAWSKPPLSL